MEKQPARFDLIPPISQRLLAEAVAFAGDVSTDEHVGKCMEHVNEFMLGSANESHLVTALAHLSKAVAAAVKDSRQPRHYIPRGDEVDASVAAANTIISAFVADVVKGGDDASIHE